MTKVHTKSRTRKPNRKGLGKVQISLADLEKLGVDTHICSYCKEPLRLRFDQRQNIPSYYLFMNKQNGIYKLMHRICKPKYLETIRS